MHFKGPMRYRGGQVASAHYMSHISVSRHVLLYADDEVQSGLTKDAESLIYAKPYRPGKGVLNFALRCTTLHYVAVRCPTLSAF